MMNMLAAQPINLWSGLAPGENAAEAGVPAKKPNGNKRGGEVTTPTLEVFPADKEKATGTAVLVCPGGGYNILAIGYEGTELCKWLSKNGITGVLLKYRVPRRKNRAKHAAPLQDAQRAMTMIRANAKAWNIDPRKIGVMGFSAGGHLAATLLGDPKRDYPDEEKYKNVSSKPDFGILIYPAYLQNEKNKTELAPELNFTKDSQAVFIAVAKNDPYYPSSVLLGARLKELGAPVEMHVFPTGGHGFGMGAGRGGDVKTWPGLCLKWMKKSGFYR